MRVIAGMMVKGEGTTLPNKNTYPICGRPMIEWALKAAKEAEFIDDVWVWTESKKLQDIVSGMDCHVIERRRDQLYYHGDMSNAIEWKEDREGKILKQLGTLGDIRVHLNCNLCLITPEILTEMNRKLMNDPQAGEVVPVCRVDPKLFTVNSQNGKLFPVWNLDGLDRQDYPPLFRAGGVHILHAKRYKKKVSLQKIHHEVPAKYLIDVHDEEDANLAEYYLSGGDKTLHVKPYPMIRKTGVSYGWPLI